MFCLQQALAAEEETRGEQQSEEQPEETPSGGGFSYTTQDEPQPVAHEPSGGEVLLILLFLHVSMSKLLSAVPY